MESIAKRSVTFVYSTELPEPKNKNTGMFITERKRKNFANACVDIRKSVGPRPNYVEISVGYHTPPSSESSSFLDNLWQQLANAIYRKLPTSSHMPNRLKVRSGFCDVLVPLLLNEFDGSPSLLCLMDQYLRMSIRFDGWCI